METETPTYEMSEPGFISSSEESESDPENPLKKILLSASLDEDLKRRLKYDSQLMRNCKGKKTSQAAIPVATPSTSGYKPPRGNKIEEGPAKCPEKKGPAIQTTPENPWTKRREEREKKSPPRNTG